MKRIVYTLFLALSVTFLTECGGKAELDGPSSNNGGENIETTEEPAAFPVDVKTVLDDCAMIRSVTSYNTYSLHSGIYVGEIRYVDYAGSDQAVFVMQVDLSDETVSMTNTVPGGAYSEFIDGRENLTAQLRRTDAVGSRVMGGVNTDFFTNDAGANSGRPSGIFWHNGICIKDTFGSEANFPRSFVYWDEKDQVNLAASAEYSLIKSLVTLKEAFSGGRFLLREGKITNIISDAASGVHPRTMIGVRKDRSKVILVVADGRQNTYAAGMNYPDMQKIMKALGSHDSINLDGGGSSTFVTRGEGTGYGSEARFEVRNKPSDGMERAIGPGLAVIVSD